MSNLIFVGGIHGVGKTTICNELTKYFNIDLYSASNIIAQTKQQSFTSNKFIADINSNQEFLAEGLKQINSKNKYGLLDGHFCLLNKGGKITKLSDKVFSDIRPLAFIVVTDDILKISTRLQKRDNKKYDLDFLDNFQIEEIAHATSIANQFSTSLYIFNNSNDILINLIHFITNLGVMN
ncbi:MULTISPECIES: ATP-binding protein [Paenibacillus]|uniref:AAA family ATPase n=1 Tax=Paenibacillus borealis TaxID=160799 RepID=A0ABX3GTT1_PAEBO|nr:ATP-binding protein [Paenibacillus borealis]OMD37020.1 hypothetical protein BSK56_31665 [Paenibacillus borealis]